MYIYIYIYSYIFIYTNLQGLQQSGYPILRQNFIALALFADKQARN